MNAAVAIEWGRPGRLSRWDALAATGLFAWLVAAAFPALPLLQRIWPACRFLAWTGLPCGTCGFTRAFVAGARFDVAGAFGASPLGALIFFTWIAASVWIVAARVAPGVRLPRVRFHPLLERFGPLALFLGNWAWMIARAKGGG